MIYEVETEEDYQQALLRFLEICENQKGTCDVKEMFLLIDLMGKYERENCSVN